MPRAMLNWELGGGLGHLHRLRAVADRLAAGGVEVTVVLKDLARAGEYFGGGGYTCFQAPVFHKPGRNPVRDIYTYAHLLHNVGFEGAGALRPRIAAWRALYDAAQPDVLLFDHAPTALLAARGHDAGKIVLGTGFEVPPAVAPLPNMRTDGEIAREEVLRAEERVLSVINEALDGDAGIERLCDVYAADARLLLTVPELDHYRDRDGGEYIDVPAPEPGAAPAWPDAEGPRVFMYLKPFKGIETFFAVLTAAPCSCCVYMERVPKILEKYVRAANLRFSADPLDLARMAAECDMAVCHASHDTTARLLARGRPVFMIPIYLEQAITAENVKRAGCGLASPHFDADGQEEQFRRMLGDASFADAAERMFSKYGQRDPADAIERIASAAQGLV